MAKEILHVDRCVRLYAPRFAPGHGRPPHGGSLNMSATRGNAQAEVRYYVWEMSVRDRKQPLRQVNKSPLPLEKAKQMARIGAQKGKHDRAVTTSPTSPKGFRIVAQYAAGAGKDVAIMYRRGTGGAPRRKPAARKNGASSLAQPSEPEEPETQAEPAEPLGELDEHGSADEV